MHIQDFFQNFLKLFLVGLHSDCTISLIAQDMSPGKGQNGTEAKQNLKEPSGNESELYEFGTTHDNTN